MCEEWKNDVRTFIAYMGPCPGGFTLERVDNDGDYEPGNCVWASRLTQAQNRRTNRLYEYGGVRQTLPQWATELELTCASLSIKLNGGATLGELVSARTQPLPIAA